MAGDWIKMRQDLNEDPSVVLIASATGADEDSIVGKLHRLWCWADKHTTNGKAPAITKAWVDKYVGLSGFADAMVQAAWLSFDSSGIQFPNFDRHNGQSAKARAEATLRQRLSRENRDNGVTGAARTPIPRPFARHVLERDGYQCVYCGVQSTAAREATFKKLLSIDHIKPESRGGSAAVENLAACCFKCNGYKSDRTPEEWGVQPTYLQPGVSYVEGQMSQKCHEKTVTEALPEKRREEKRREEEKTPLPPKAKKAEAEEPEPVVHEFGAPTDGRARIDTAGDSFDAVASVFEGRGFGGVKFQNALRGFYDHRRASGKPLTTSSAAAMAAKFESNGGEEPAIRALIDSTANGWQGVFPEKYQREAKAGKGSIGDVIAEMQRRREQDERRSA